MGIVIPRELRREAKLKLGDKVVVEKDATGVILVYPKGSTTKRPSITPEFLEWLNNFNKRYSKALSVLARS